MVVFTCSYCGDSVKKNQVEKHYQFGCRQSIPALTCVDCLKDFNGKEYVSHTSCVTEEERYSAKGFVSKPPSRKGQEKQSIWVNLIRTVVESNPKLDVSVKCLLQDMVKDGAVPQKKSKFMNYCISKFRNKCDRFVFERAWETLEMKREELKRNNVSQNEKINENQINGNNEGKEGKKRKRIDSNNVLEENGVCTKELENSVESERKKKKKQKREMSDKSSNELEHGAVAIKTVEETGKSKKKKKKTIHEDEQNIENDDTGNTTEEIDKTEEHEIKEEKIDTNECFLSKKEKKEKRKRERYEKQLQEIKNEVNNEVCVEDEQVVDESVNTKKNKKRDQENGESVSIIEPKSKKKKKKHQELDNITLESGENNENQGGGEENETETTRPQKFNWEETVLKVLQSKGDLPLKRLEKKIVSEYVKSGAHVESIEKVISKFNKKIVKMPSVKVKKEVVKLVS